MEQTQSNIEIRTLNPSPPAFTFAYPPNYYQTMATNYVHHLKSSPYYYYFIPHYTYASGYNNPHSHYAYNSHIPIGYPAPGFNTSPNLEAHNNNISVQQQQQQQHHVIIPTPNNQETCLEMQESAIHQGDEVKKLEKKLEGSLEENENLLVDPRIVSILEPLRQLYSEREESLKNVFPSLYSKLSELFKKVNSLILEGINIEREKSTGPTLTRSLSLGSTTYKNERFKVRPIDSDDVGIPTSLEGTNADGNQM